MLTAAAGTKVDDFRHRFSTKAFEAAGDSALPALYYDGYRYYAPRHGRWLSRDPIGEEGGLLLYGFCGNGPLGAVDALGLLTPQRFFDKWDETKQKEWLRSRLHNWAPAIWTAAEKHGVPARLLSITILNEMIDYGTWGDYRVGGGYNFLERTVEVLTGLGGSLGPAEDVFGRMPNAYNHAQNAGRLHMVYYGEISRLLIEEY